MTSNTNCRDEYKRWNDDGWIRKNTAELTRKLHYEYISRSSIVAAQYHSLNTSLHLLKAFVIFFYWLYIEFYYQLITDYLLFIETWMPNQYFFNATCSVWKFYTSWKTAGAEYSKWVMFTCIIHKSVSSHPSW